MQNSYKAVFLDLDGTLLQLDEKLFLKAYFDALGKISAERGFDAEAMCKAVGKSVSAMLDHEPGILNSQAFWTSFVYLWGPITPKVVDLFDSFYETTFNEIGRLCTPNPYAAQLIKELKDKGYLLYLTTLPLFPRIAVENRLRWAGVDPAAFSRITTYDNSTACKPKLQYYQENVDFIGLEPSEILMVGNNTLEDLAAMELGMDAFLVTDCLINPNNFDVETVRHGGLADLAAFVHSLPTCEAEGEER